MENCGFGKLCSFFSHLHQLRAQVQPFAQLCGLPKKLGFEQIAARCCSNLAQGFSKGFPMVPITLQWFPIVSDGFEVGLEACRTQYILHKPELTLSLPSSLFRRRVDLGYGPIRSRNTARWAMLGACAAGSKVLLEMLGLVSTNG